MPPPPSGSLPLKDRFLALAQTLQFAWFVGHLTLLFCILRYGLSYITFNYYSRWAVFSYRTAFVSAAVTYGIVVYKAFRSRMRGGSIQGGYVSLAADENVQYLAMALVWLFAPQHALALLPFGVYSIFHVLTYTRTYLIPTFQPPPASTPTPASPASKPAKATSPLAESIGTFVKEYYEKSMGLVAILEIVLWFRILGSAIIFVKGSWILLVLYSAFLRARLAHSSFVKDEFAKLTGRIDSLVGAQGTHPMVKQGWASTKAAGQQFHDATDMSKYFSTAAPGPVPVKKTS